MAFYDWIKFFPTNPNNIHDDFAKAFLNNQDRLIWVTDKKHNIISANDMFLSFQSIVAPAMEKVSLADIFLDELELFDRLEAIKSYDYISGSYSFNFSPRSLFLRQQFTTESSCNLTLEISSFYLSGKDSLLWQLYRNEKLVNSENYNFDVSSLGLSNDSFVEHLPFPVALFSADGLLLSCNPLYELLWDDELKLNDQVKKELKLGKHSISYLKEIFSEGSYKSFCEIFDNLPRGEQRFIDITLERPYEYYLQCRLYSLPLKCEQQFKHGLAKDKLILISFAEITSQKLLEENAIESQKMQAVGRLAGGIAHDFNNVLTSIIISSDMLLSKHRRSDPSFLDLINIKQNAERAASLVRQLLAFSRRQTLRPKVLDLTELLADWRLMLSNYIKVGIDFRIEHGSNLWPVKVDVDEFSRVLVNLVVNSVDAMPDGGSLIIRTNNLSSTEEAKFKQFGIKAADYVQLEVEDTGVGIDSAQLSKIFEPFFTTKEVGKGTGLGLAMSYGIIKQTGGYLLCESQKGLGTIFRILLPRYIAKVDDENVVTSNKILIEENKEKNSSKPLITDLSGSANILYVEDEDTVRVGGVRILKSRGYKVFEARSGLEALEILKSQADNKIDLIVSDVVMPEMDGPTLLKELHKLNMKIPFIFVSGYAEEAFAKHLPEDLQFTFLPKPFSLKQLATCVKQTLEK